MTGVCLDCTASARCETCEEITQAEARRIVLSAKRYVAAQQRRRQRAQHRKPPCPTCGGKLGRPHAT